MTALFRPIRSTSGFAAAALAAVTLLVFVGPFIDLAAAWAVS